MKRIFLLFLVFVLLLPACSRKEAEPYEPEIDDTSIPSALEPSPLPPSPSDAQPSDKNTDVPIPEPPVADMPIPQALSPLTDEEFWHRIDGSTATFPMSCALFDHFMKSDNYVGDAIYHNRTHEAYENLLNGYKDVIFVTEPSAEALKMFSDAGVGFDIIPIVKDAFVFLVNGKNPVDSLTQDQLRSIYSGDITNWKDVGGEDADIIPFQRQSTSGSQTLFLSLLMRDTEPMLAPSEYYLQDMGGVVDAVADYKNSAASIGFSVFYYAYAMYGNNNVRFLKVDGVMPTEESIIDGEYPLGSCYYAVLRTGMPVDHPARLLVSWILSDAGQELMRKTGYVPLRKLAAPYDKSDAGPDYFGDYDYHRVYGFGAELAEYFRIPNDSIDVYNITKELNTGAYYSHPFTSSPAVNDLLSSFIEGLLAKEDFKERIAENIHKYGVPFNQHTLTWGDYLTCLVYFGEQQSRYLYDDIYDDSFDAYASVCIDTVKGKVIDPDVIIEALMKIDYMKGAKSVYEQRECNLCRPDPGHIPSNDYTIKALWIHSEQAVIIEVLDKGNRYRYGVCTNSGGGYAGS